MSDIDIVKSYLVQGPLNSLEPSNVRRLTIEVFGSIDKSTSKTLETVAATNVAKFVSYWNRPRRVHKVYLMPEAALTGDNTDYATIACSYNNAAGGAKTNVTTKATTLTAAGTGNWASGTVLDISPTSPVDVPAGSALWYDTWKTANGLNVVASVMVVQYEELGT